MASPPDAYLQFMREERLFHGDGLRQIASIIAFTASSEGNPAGNSEEIVKDKADSIIADESPGDIRQQRKELLLAVSSSSTKSLRVLQHYRHVCLRAIWNAKSRTTTSNLQIGMPNEGAQVKSRQRSAKDLGLLLLVPLLESQSRSDPHLCGATVNILLQFLLDVSPGALKDSIPRDVLQNIERLLTTWLTQDIAEDVRSDAISSLIALTCAVGSLTSIVRTIGVLQMFDKSLELHLGNTLKKLLQARNISRYSLLPSTAEIKCLWKFDTYAGLPDSKIQNRSSPVLKHPKFSHKVQFCSRGSGWSCDGGCGFRSSRSAIEMPRYRSVDENQDFDLCAYCMGSLVQHGRSSMCSDGTYLYFAGWAFQGLIKVGTGHRGTIQGHVYARNSDLCLGRVTLCGDVLLFRPFDCESNQLCVALDTTSLRSLGQLERPQQEESRPPICQAGHSMTLSSYAEGAYKGGFICDQCGDRGVSERWFCAECSSDLCLSCSKKWRGEDICFSAEGNTLHHVYLDHDGSSQDTEQVPLINDTYNVGAKYESKTYSSATTKDVPVLFVRTTELRNSVDKPNSATPIRSNDSGSKKRDKMSTIGLSVLTLRGTISYVSKGTLILLSKMTGTLGMPSQSISRLAFGGREQNSGNSNIPAVFLDQHCVDLTENGSSLACPIPRVCLNEHLAGAMSRMDELCVAVEPDGDKIWLNVASTVEQWSSKKFRNEQIIASSSELLEMTSNASIAEATESMFELLLAAADGHDAICVDEIPQLTKCTVSMLKLAFDERHASALLGGLRVLQLCLHSSSNIQFVADLEIIKSFAIDHLEEPCDGAFITPKSQAACSDLLITRLDLFFPTIESKLDFVTDICSVSGKLNQVEYLRILILDRLAQEMKIDGEICPAAKPDIFFEIVELLFENATAELRMSLEAVKEQKLEMEVSSAASANVVTLAAINHHFLSKLTEDKVSSDETRLTHQFTSHLLLSCYKLSSDVQKAVLSINESGNVGVGVQNQMEKIFKTSMLGFLLPSTIAIYSKSTGFSAALEKENCDAIKILCDLVHNISKALSIFDDAAADLESIPTPRPWERGITLESIHPLRDNYKFTKTVAFPGADAIYLTFDPRCCSQYDYDKLSIGAGRPDAPGYKVVKQYGGNTAGYGSRSVLGDGWPKVPLQVSGDTVTLEFEMRSGRESATPDSAIWGFKVTLRDQETTENKDSSTSFHTDLALGLASWTTTLIETSYLGIAPHKNEMAVDASMNFEILHTDTTEIDSKIEHDLLPKVRDQLTASNDREPMYPLSVRKAVETEDLQTQFILAGLSCIGSLNKFTVELSKDPIDPRIVNLFDFLVKKLRGVERLLLDLSNHERLWWDAVDKIQNSNKSANEAFFNDWHLVHGQKKALRQLCELVGAKYDKHNEEAIVDTLISMLKEDVLRPAPSQRFPYLREIAMSIRNRCAFLLSLNLSPDEDWSAKVLEGIDKVTSTTNIEFRSDSPMESPSRAPVRVFSAPPVLEKLKKKQRDLSDSIRTPGEVETLESLPVIILDQEFTKFVMYGVFDPKARFSLEELSKVAAQRQLRAKSRLTALEYISALLQVGVNEGDIAYPAYLQQYFVESLTGMFLRDTIDKDLACSGLSRTIRQKFGTAMRDLLTVVKKFPESCYRGLGLCALPFARRHAGCLVDSGLAEVLAVVCTSNVGAVVDIAWQSFHCIAFQCAQWRDNAKSLSESVIRLSEQISNLLSHHLHGIADRDITYWRKDQIDSSRQRKQLQILSTLDGLAGSQLGKAVVVRPICIVSLLIVLADERSTPRLLNILTRLLAVALPFVNDSAEMLQLITSSSRLRAHLGNSDVKSARKAITLMLLKKLADVVVPPCKDSHLSSVIVGAASQEVVTVATPLENNDEPEQKDVPSELLSLSCSGAHVVKIFRRNDQTARDVIESLVKLNRRLFRSKDSVENVVRIDQELNANSVAVAFRGQYNTCCAVAQEWAELGTLVSIEKDTLSSKARPVEISSAEAKQCKVLNEVLAKQPPRHFIDESVAGGIAHELIGLIQSLMAGDDDSWDEDAGCVLSDALNALPELASKLSCDNGAVPSEIDLAHARNALAALCILGAFRSDIHVGGHALIGGFGLRPSVGEIRSYETEEGSARVKFPAVTHPVKVAVDQILDAQSSPPNRIVSMLTEIVMNAVNALLAAGSDHQMGVQSATVADLLPDKQIKSRLEFAHRLLADLRSRTCMLMCVKLRSGVTALPSAESCQLIKRLAMEAQDASGTSLSAAESACSAVRRPYYNQFRPRMPILGKTDGTRAPSWNLSNVHPAVCGLILQDDSIIRSVRIARRDNGVKTSMPILFADSTLPVINSKYAYWEVRVAALPNQIKFESNPQHHHSMECVENDNGWGCDGVTSTGANCKHGVGETSGVDRWQCALGCDFDMCGDCMSDSLQSTAFEIGFTSKTKRSDWEWSVDTILFTSAREVYRRSASDPELVKQDFNLLGPQNSRRNICVGDTIGCLLDKSLDRVVFYVNGKAASSGIPSHGSNLLPVVHINIPGIQLDTVLKVDPCNFPEECIDMIDGEDASPITSSGSIGAIGEIVTVSHDAPTTPKRVLDNFVLPLSGSPQPGHRRVAFGEEEEEEEDFTELLIQAWEREVFPKIHGRFRNSTERQSGFDQIRGALQFNMPDVAMDTVQGLYDDNGGLPADFHLPTIDDLKASAGQLGANEIQSGMRVRKIANSSIDHEVSSMRKTRMLSGVVVKVDQARSLALVEMYVESDAAVTHWWYPCSVLELAEGAIEKSDIDLNSIHQEYLLCEAKLTRLYCRSALLLLRNATLMEVPIAQALSLMSYESRFVPKPGGCFVKSATVDNFYSVNTRSFKDFNSCLIDSLSSAFSSGTHEIFIADICEHLKPSDGRILETVNLDIREGRKVVDVEFSKTMSNIHISLRGPEGTAGRLPTLATEEGPWLRIYARSNCNGPRAAVYPCLESGAPFPFYSIPSSRLHLRIRPADLPSGLQVCLHGLHRDIPCAIAFIQGPLISHPDLPASSYIYVAELLVNSLSKYEAAPQMREVYHHSLAAVLRRAGPVFSSELRSSIHSIHSSGGGSISSDFHNIHLSTYFQSMLELAVADQANNRLYRLGRQTNTHGNSISSSSAFPSPEGQQYAQKPSKGKSRKKHGDRNKEHTPSRKRTASGSKALDPAASTKAWVRRAAETELFLRRLHGKIASHDVCRLIDEELVTIGHSSAVNAQPTQCLLGCYRISPDIGKAEIISTIPKLLASCGGVVDNVFVSDSYDDLGRFAVMQLRSAAVTDRVKHILQNSAQLKGPVNVSFFGTQILNCDTIVELPEGAGNEKASIAASVLHQFLLERILTSDSKLNSAVSDAVMQIFGLKKVDLAKSQVLLQDVLDDFEAGEAYCQQQQYQTQSIDETFNVATVTQFLRSVGYNCVDDLGPLISFCEADVVTPQILFSCLAAIGLANPGRIFAVLTEYGYDLNFKRYRYRSVEKAISISSEHHWLRDADQTLVKELDQLALSLHVPILSLKPYDYHLDQGSELGNDFDLLSIRQRVGMLLALNDRILELLPSIDFRGPSIRGSLADLVNSSKSLICYDVANSWISSMLDKTSQRDDSNGPEITLNPFTSLKSKQVSFIDSHFMQSLTQLESIDPTQFRVKLARGGDPVFPINVKLSGEHVAGSSGSFREFMARMAVELMSEIVPLMTDCASAGFGVNVGFKILKIGQPDYLTVRLLELVGLIFGFAIRADVPLGLQLLPSFWKSLVGVPLTFEDIAAADCNFATRMSVLKTANEEEFEDLVERESIDLRYRKLDGSIADLGPALLADGNSGKGHILSWELKDAYIAEVEKSWIDDLTCEIQSSAIKRGMCQIVQPGLLSVLTWQNLENRICGRSYIDLAFLKAHTTYTVGLSEIDQHIQYFWKALESFNQEQLQKFVKFACNQHRIPSDCPCQNGSKAHIPPYPMKIAPADKGRSDRRWIRAETCMFMIKLPQYSSQELMTERLLGAIQCRDDPLIG